MKKIFCLFMMICAYSSIFAQNLTVKSVNLRVQDARAATQPREDKSGKKCAIIRVGVVGVDDLVFPDAVGSVEQALNEYIVYVPDGLKQLRYENKAGKQLGAIVFDDYDLEVNSLASYDVIFESENHLRSAIFSIQPKNAQLLFDGKQIDVDADGIAMINAPVGEYSYQITAEGFESQSGTVVLAEDEISTTTGVVLQEILYPVTIKVFPEDATVFIDNVPYTIKDRKNLQLPAGKHAIRVTATNCEDAERVIDVNNNITPVDFYLKGSKQKIIKHKEEETRTNANIRGTSSQMLGMEAIDNENMNLYGVRFDSDFIQHLGEIFAIRWGLAMSLMRISYKDSFDFESESKEELEDSVKRTDFEIPVQLGVRVPLGKYNQHHFYVFAGGYGRASFLGGHKVAEKYRDKLSEAHFELQDEYWDFGLRVSFKLNIFKFTIGADVSKSLTGKGVLGAIGVGLKIY